MENPDAAEKKPRTKKSIGKPDAELKQGQILKSNKGFEYLVESQLGSGGFGQVWKVSLLKEPDKKFAMKTEQNVAAKKDMLRLKCEVNLFDEIERASNRTDKSHFVRMHDKGKTSQFKYLVMDLIWLSLKDVKETVCGDVFSPHTKIKVARQTLKGIESLHDIGFLHRDIKPHNFAVGLPPKESIIYLLDFGIARPYKDKDGEVRKARKTVKFMGTLQYASMECLCRNEQSRRDDLEVWMYMMLEFYDRTNLLWWNLEAEDAQLHVEMRSELMTKSRELLADGRLKVPEKWCDIIEVLNQMNYEDPGDFTQINLSLSQICVDENIDENLPLDWIGKKPNSLKREEKKKEKEKQKEKEKEKEKEREKKKEIAVRKKKSAAKPKEAEEKEGEAQRRRKSDQDSDGEETDFGDSAREDFEAFMQWRKKRRNKKKRQSKDRGSNEQSDRDRLRRPQKKESAEKRSDDKKRDKDVDPNEDVEMEVEATAPQFIESKKESNKIATPEAKKEKEKKVSKKSGPRKKTTTQSHDGNEEKKKTEPQKKSGGTPESNESNDREDKVKRKMPKRKSKGSGEEKEDSNQKKIPRESNRKKYERKKPTNKSDQKSPAVKSATPDGKKAPKSLQ